MIRNRSRWEEEQDSHRECLPWHRPEEPDASQRGVSGAARPRDGVFRGFSRLLRVLAELRVGWGSPGAARKTPGKAFPPGKREKSGQ